MCRSAKDTYLEKNEENFVQTVRDGVINALEVEKQSVCAYTVWKDHEHHPGAFKRGMSKIRASLRRARTSSTGGGGRRKAKQEGWWCVFALKCFNIVTYLTYFP